MLALEAASGEPRRHDTTESTGTCGSDGAGRAERGAIQPSRAGRDRPATGPRGIDQLAGLRRNDCEAFEQGWFAPEEQLQWEVRAPALGGVNRAHGIVVRNVGGDAVDGIGREDDELSGAERLDGVALTPAPSPDSCVAREGRFEDHRSTLENLCVLCVLCVLAFKPSSPSPVCCSVLRFVDRLRVFANVPYGYRRNR